MSAELEDGLQLEEGHPSLGRDRERKGVPVWTVLAILLVAAGIGFVVFDGLKSETYFYTVDQAVAQGPKLVGQHVRVKGTVEPGSVVGAAGELGRTFRIDENGKSIRVTYDKAMPDTFQENREVVVKGTVNDKMTVVADEVLVKCPSRYEAHPPTAERPRASL